MTSFMLKIIALICMSIDHIGAVFPMFTPSVFRDIGRIAFPIYIFLMAEGVDRTKNINKYILRLFVFAIISESAFDLAFNQTYMIEKGMPLQIDFLNSTNIYYTLFISIATINIYEKLKNKENQFIANILIVIIPILYYLISVYGNQSSLISIQIAFFIYFIILIYLSFKLKDEIDLNYNSAYYENYIKYKKCLLAFIPVIPLFMLGEIFSTDYGILGVFIIFLVYVVKSKRNRIIALTAWIAFEYFYLYIDSIRLNFMNISTFIFAMLSILFITKYNGKQGKKMKWFFYWFYPLHLAILAFILILFVRPMLNGF